MLLEAYQKLGGETFKLDDLAVVIVKDRFDNPLLVACELAPGHYEVSKVGDPEFDTVLKTLGFDKTVIVTSLGGPPPNPRDRQLLKPGGVNGR